MRAIKCSPTGNNSERNNYIGEYWLKHKSLIIGKNKKIIRYDKESYAV